MKSSTSKARRPLSGLVVIEAGSLIAASFCGQLLADFGATVIKIEPPKERSIDTLRQWGRKYKHGEGFLPSILNRNKKLITLDLSRPEGIQVLKKLLIKADALVENFKPGTFASWGLGENELKNLNEQLIHVAISGFGQNGPMSNLPAFGAIAEAMGGMRNLIGYPDRPPVRPGVSIGDFLAGLYSAFGLSMALVERNNSKKGQLVDVAIYESVMGVMEDLLPMFSFFDITRGPVGPGFDRFAPSSIFPTKDGGWVLIAAPTDGPFKKLCLCMERSELITDERFNTQTLRADHRLEIDAIVSQWSMKFETDELVEILRKGDVPVGKSYTAKDIMSDEHIRYREMVVRVNDERFGEIAMQGVVPKMSRTPGEISHPGGPIGMHTQEIYSEFLNLTQEEIDGLHRSKVI
jgi:formyl-CoA transferase